MTFQAADYTKNDRHNEKALALDTSAVLLETASGGDSHTAPLESSITTVGSVGAAVVPGQERSNPVLPTADDSAISVAEPIFAGQQPQMKAPHISTLYKKKDVMAKHFGVTQKQALRTQALLRLGVTDEDVRIAERLMGPRSAGDNTQSKAEWLLGYTHAQMSYHKALEVLGVSEAVVEEERARRLGELGLASWGGTSLSSEACAGQEGDDMCGGFFAKRRRSASQDATPLGTTLPGEVAFAPAHSRVLQLEEVCHSQLNRIQQLENQLAALSADSPSDQ